MPGPGRPHQAADHAGRRSQDGAATNLLQGRGGRSSFYYTNSTDQTASRGTTGPVHAMARVPSVITGGSNR